MHRGREVDFNAAFGPFGRIDQSELGDVDLIEGAQDLPALSRMGPSLLCANIRQFMRTSDCIGPLSRVINSASHVRSDFGMAESPSISGLARPSLTSSAARLPARRP